MKPKVFLLSLGCPRNLVDSEVLMGLLKERGYTVTNDPDPAQVYIVNTCAFIESAKQESIDAILEMSSFKENHKSRRVHPKKKLIVTGCLSQRYPEELKKELPQIDGIFGSSDFVKIPEFIDCLSGQKTIQINRNPDFLYNHRSKRVFVTPRHYAYVKLQEGCMNNCSYCVIPKLRGPYRSRDFESIIEEVRILKKTKDIKEINLIGEDTTLYGIDKYKKVRLAELMKKLSSIMKNRWIRLLYTHPAHYSDELISVIASEWPICKYLDLPIQHINDRLLKEMNRNTTKKQITDLIQNLRKKIPNVILRTTVMLGFPGETEKEFEELLTFIKDIKFERLGAFTYSREEGTKAANLAQQIPDKIKEERYNRILEAQKEISEDKNRAYLKKILEVLIDEGNDSCGAQFLGRTWMDAPEVDGTCYVKSKEKIEIGSFQKVKIIDTLEYDLVGEIL